MSNITIRPGGTKSFFPCRPKADVMAPSDRKPFGSKVYYECITRKASLKKNYPSFTNFNDAEFMQ